MSHANYRNPPAVSRRCNPPARLPEPQAQEWERKLRGHYEAVQREGHEAWKLDTALRYRGALASFSALGKAALIAEARRHGLKVSPKVRKEALVARLARMTVPDWREALDEERLPRICRPPKLTKADREALADAPEEQQDLAQALVTFCDNTDPEQAREKCEELDAAALAAGYVSVSDAMKEWGMSQRAVDAFYDLCPVDVEEVPF